MPVLQDGQVAIGGNYERDTLHIEPTVVKDITWQDAVMEDEILVRFYQL